jgi:uncharacterized protein YdeI (YjbR/CyaY-like superfamily)
MATTLPIVAFETRATLRAWLEENHASSDGILVRIFKKGTGLPTVTFEDVLDEGLCFGWSESTRLPLDEVSYLQRFSPRRGVGTTSARNLDHARALIAEGLMTEAGLRSLGLD